MKAALVLALCALLAGCIEAQADVPLDRVPMKQTTGARFFVDPDTGCHYLVAFSKSITPRLTADGKQLCVQ